MIITDVLAKIAGAMWPTYFALAELTAAEARIGALVEKAVS